MDSLKKNKRPRYLLPILSITLGLFLAVTGLVKAGAWQGFWDLVADRTADRIVSNNPDLTLQGDEVLGGVGESLAVRNLTGLFDLTLKDGDGTESGQSKSQRLITGDWYESAGSGAASATLASVQNATGQRNLLCAPDIGVQLFASSTANPGNMAQEILIATSSVSSVVWNATHVQNPLFAISLEAGTLTADGRMLTASSTGLATAGGYGSDCVVWEPNDYVVLTTQAITASQAVTSSYMGGVASSSFYWLSPRQMATSS